MSLAGVNHKQLLEDIAVAAREAGAAILQIVERGFEVESKEDLSPVTIADRAAELIILGALAKAAPGVPVIAEEEVAAGRIPAHGDTYFLVDPLDGTKEFIRGCATSAASSSSTSSTWSDATTARR